MTGTIINALAILVCGLLGLLFRKGISENLNRTLQDGLGILIMIIGLQYGFKAENLAVVGISLAIGGVIGEWRQWEAKLEQLGQWVEKRLGGSESQFAKGFVTGTLVFCIGAMAIVGALEDGLTHHYQILLVKSMLDGILSIIFAASMGIGVAFSSIPVFLYQGAISLGAGLIKPILTDPMLNNITALGGILITAIGLNTANITRIRVANLLPGLFLVPFIMMLFRLFPF